MRILTPEGEAFDVSKLNGKQHFTILDVSDADNIDYRCAVVNWTHEYEWPAIELQIGPYRLEVPLNWRILTGDSNEGELELVDIEQIPNFDYDAFVLNPFKSFMPKFMPVHIVNSYGNSMTMWSLPKLQKKQIMAVPLGQPSEWPERLNPESGKTEPYPLCAYFVDDSDKMNDVLDIRDVF